MRQVWWQSRNWHDPSNDMEVKLIVEGCAIYGDRQVPVALVSYRMTVAINSHMDPWHASRPALEMDW